MKKQPDKSSIRTLRDAYRVRGFHVQAKIDSYDELKYPAFVVTLDRRSKKRFAADAGKFVAGFTINAGGARAILDAETGTFISIFTCAA
jgi:hypothetical protein